jgi:hypothetical protein
LRSIIARCDADVFGIEAYDGGDLSAYGDLNSHQLLCATALDASPERAACAAAAQWAPPPPST